MNVEQTLKEIAAELRNSRREIEVAPDISEKSIDKWNKKYTDNCSADITNRIIILSMTATGSIALTGDRILYDNFVQKGLNEILYKDISDIFPREGGLFDPDVLNISLRDGTEKKLDGCIDGLDVNKFALAFNQIVRAYQDELKEDLNAEFITSQQNVSLFAIDDDAKELYLEILCNYAYIDDMDIDAAEYNTILGVSVRMNANKETRKSLRKYIFATSMRETTGTLLRNAHIVLEDKNGQWDAFRYSLLQDVLYIKEQRNQSWKWQDDGFVGSLMEHLDLCPSQVDTMQKAVFLNKRSKEISVDAQSKDERKKLKDIKDDWNALIRQTKGTDGYVPMQYLFCSGSIYGINSYKSFIKSDATSPEAINKQRELILHDVIINTQKMVNVLAQDMCFMAERIEKMRDDSSAGQAELEIMQRKYDRILSALKLAAREQNDSENAKDNLNQECV